METVATHQKTQQGLKRNYIYFSVNSNYVATHQKTQQGLKQIKGQLMNLNDAVATHQKTQQGLKHIAVSFLEVIRRSRNASENPAGIETPLR